ncbi:(2Fe-2S)-binding protein [Dyella sp.]|jgi:xanthine dehydrogenase YagT iron-sulfur-binding subunit|uniref:(2Fe-2S)-binding protein n=1 Tax=Dyella sp. TaxID=1869338 RepID=UPI002D79E178|nr:2Fe-2S iron-sulfur cluster-binding protein [Dyella sp.]HET6432804.1 2Fe-2S iron-sulfur cluster-binding protein [Dyella sp.]
MSDPTPEQCVTTFDSADRVNLTLSRRSFLQMVGMTGAASTLGLGGQALAATAMAHVPDVGAGATAGDDQVTVQFTVNGKPETLTVDPRTTLLDALREHLHLTGTKKGCDHGQCGACTVHADGRRVNSCLSLLAMHEGGEVTTIEGLGQPGQLHPMQQAFLQHDGYQCGYCTSGQIMSATALLDEPWGPADADVKEAMAGNICRCGAYPNIVAAIQQVRKG